MFVYIKTAVKPLTAALLTLAFIASCGGEEEAAISGHERVAVVEAWTEALAAGEVGAAADLFAIPSVAQNGGTPLTLSSRRDAIAFNRSLPCGGELVRARAAGRFIVAVIRLTERPGAGSCGSGTGRLARTAFAIREGKIAEWRRLADPDSDQSAEPIV